MTNQEHNELKISFAKDFLKYVHEDLLQIKAPHFDIAFRLHEAKQLGYAELLGYTDIYNLADKEFNLGKTSVKKVCMDNLPLILDGPTLGAINQVIEGELGKYKQSKSLFADISAVALRLLRAEINKTKYKCYDKRHKTFLLKKVRKVK